MATVNIIIPVDNYNETEIYYRSVLSSPFIDGLFFLPGATSEVALKLMIVDAESESSYPPKKRFPLFSYRMEKNFLSYCNEICKNGALIEMACATPGGYYARVSDVAGNQFEIECESFDEDDPTVDSSKMPFFFSY
jgi:hypothetical protein